MKGWMYMLECADGTYYTGSTNNLEERLFQHQSGQGANHTKKRLPVKLVYFEEYPRIDDAFFREKQIQGWSRRKKKALINGEYNRLPEFAVAYRDRDGGFESLSHRTTEASDNHNKPLSEVLEDSVKKVRPA
jgi:putative endonuclease